MLTLFQSFYRWNPVEKTAEEEMFSDSTVHKLIIKQFLLGVEAKDGEFNVVEVRFLFTLTYKIYFIILIEFIS